MKKSELEQKILELETKILILENRFPNTSHCCGCNHCNYPSYYNPNPFYYGPTCIGGTTSSGFSTNIPPNCSTIS